MVAMLKRQPTAIRSLIAGILCIPVLLYLFRHRNLLAADSQAGAARSSRDDATAAGDVQTQLRDPISPPIHLARNEAYLKPVQNATLGFQKIYVISLPSRSDKRDSISLAAYLLGLEVEFIDGVEGEKISPKAFPLEWNDKEPPGTIGCWRGHMEAYQKMLRGRIETALIMEDDVDWDVFIKAQFTDFARGTRHIQKATSSARSPYGDDWDFLSTGHCGFASTPADQDIWVTRDDPSVEPPTKRLFPRKPHLPEQILKDERTRTVITNTHLTCLASYAMTLSGAARIVYDQDFTQNSQPIDLAIGRWCRRRPYGDKRCIAVFPPLTGVYRAAGDAAKQSDRKALTAGKTMIPASSDRLVYSVRLNLPDLLRGSTVVKAQYPELSWMPEIDVAKFALPRGHGVHVKLDEFRPQEKLGESPMQGEVVATPAAA